MKPILLACLLFSSAVTAQTKYVFQQPEMGSPFTITIYGNDSAAVASAAAAAFKKAGELNAILSDYIDSSELNRLSATGGQHRWVPVSPPLFDILERSVAAARLSDGSYDTPSGPSSGSGARRVRHTGFPIRPN